MEQLFEAGFEQEDSQQGRYLAFTLKDEDFGIEIKYVTEIVGMQPVSTLPETPDYIRGVINLRGKIIPVIDMRLKFKMDEAQYTDRTCIVVIDTGDICAGLIVDNVAEVISIGEEDVSAPPNAKTGVTNRYLQGIGKVGGRIKLLLNCESLFTEDELSQLSDIEKGDK